MCRKMSMYLNIVEIKIYAIEQVFEYQGKENSVLSVIYVKIT